MSLQKVPFEFTFPTNEITVSVKTDGTKYYLSIGGGTPDSGLAQALAALQIESLDLEASVQELSLLGSLITQASSALIRISRLPV
jgi:hypothetical protein